MSIADYNMNKFLFLLSSKQLTKYNFEYKELNKILENLKTVNLTSIKQHDKDYEKIMYLDKTLQ